MAAAKQELIAIKPIEIQKVYLRLTGDTPIIMHAWSEKAKRMMLEAQQGKAKGKQKEIRRPADDFIQSMYWLSEKPCYSDTASDEEIMELFNDAIRNGARFGCPVTAFKQAAISAAYRSGWSKDKVSLQGAFFIESDENGNTELFSDPPIMREDMVRIGMGTADLRYRGEFRNWNVDLTIDYNKNGQYSLENIINIINAGGFSCGVFESRPEKGGQNGMYHVETN
ncbi:MAG: hypothetical protein IJK23_09785 [Clostridia bacterium]|nr:hypothetical protein [Clostridia bacterium]